MASSLETQFSALFLNRTNTTPIEWLPLEIIKLILLCSTLSNEDVFRCLVVCKRWSPLAKEVLYRHIEIGGHTNIPSLVNSLQNSAELMDVRSLTFDSIPNRGRQLRNDLPSLMSECHNLEVITIKRSNPYYILIAVYMQQFLRLRKVDLSWNTCNRSRSVQKWFYKVNYAHKDTITSITMPPRMCDMVVFGDGISMLSKEDFLDSFNDLKYISYQ